MSLIEKFNEIEKKAQEAISEQPALEAERNMLKRDISKKIAELKEMGVEFSSKEDLEQLCKDTEESLSLSLQSLERKLGEYAHLKEEINEVENKIENVEAY